MTMVNVGRRGAQIRGQPYRENGQDRVVGAQRARARSTKGKPESEQTEKRARAKSSDMTRRII